MTTVNNDPYIMVRDGVFTKEFCEHCINKFEADDRKDQGTTSGGIDLRVKKSDDLLITNYADWAEEDKSFLEVVQWSIKEYEEHLQSLIPLIERTTNKNYTHAPCHSMGGGVVTDTGYQLQRTLPGDGYVWHNDFNIQKNNGVRHVTFIFYLNTVDEGWTQFYNGSQIAPVQGRVVLFPATWTYVHQGYPPKQTKYLCTGWIFESFDQ
tara:strand:- start:44 stop:667 length:624 start_codon:yes stop_codon:yes gene_type:complete